MTEQEWLACTDAPKMLKAMRRKATDRKLRLFGCACCRSIWDLMDDERSRTVVEILERVADRVIPKSAFIIAQESARQAWLEALTIPVKSCATHAVASLTDPSDAAASVLCAVHLSETKSWQQEMARQCCFLRDLFGNSFHQTAIDPSWLRWNEGIVQRIAQTIYDDRVFDCLPILADALEEAGCDNADILNHCRQPGEHVRGCWVVDLLLGKC